MNKSPQCNQQSKSEVEEICIYQNMENSRDSIYIYLKINSGIHARKNPKQRYLKVVTFSKMSSFFKFSLHLAKRAFIFTTMQPR